MDDLKLPTNDDKTAIQVIGIGKYGHTLIQQINHIDSVQYDIFECDSNPIDALNQCIRSDAIVFLILDPAESLCHSIKIPDENSNPMFICYPKSDWDNDTQNCFKYLKQNVIATYDIHSTKEMYHHCGDIQKHDELSDIQALSLFIQCINSMINTQSFIRIEFDDLKFALSNRDIAFVMSSADGTDNAIQATQMAVNALKISNQLPADRQVQCITFTEAPASLTIDEMSTILETVEDNLTQNPDNDIFWGHSIGEDNNITIALFLGI